MMTLPSTISAARAELSPAAQTIPHAAGPVVNLGSRPVAGLFAVSYPMSLLIDGNAALRARAALRRPPTPDRLDGPSPRASPTVPLCALPPGRPGVVPAT